MKKKDETLLAEFRTAGPCQWCGRWCAARDPHHIFKRGMGAGGRLDVRINLIALGAKRLFICTCHDDADAYRIPRCSLLAKVAAREQRLQGEIEDELRRLRRTSRR